MRHRALRLLPQLSLPDLVTVLVVGGATALVFWQLDPSLLFANTTTAGGDTGAHVALPWYMEHHLLPHFRLTGWSPWWYDGYPQYTFYFPLPALFVAILNLVAPYNVAFKLVTAAGSLLLPLSAYLFGRGAGMRRPGPACLAAATLPFLFDQSFTIYGGNIASTLAGEFGFSLSLAFALMFLGLVADGLRTGKRRALAAFLLAVSALCHFVPAFWAGIGAVVLVLARWDRYRLRWAVTVAAAGVAITGFWVIPFYLGLPYTTNMGWQKVTTYVASMFPESLLWAVALAAVGAVISLVRRRRVGTFLIVMAGLSAAMFILDPTSKLYNARLLPFWILCVYLLAGVAAAELGILAADLWGRRKARWPGRRNLGQAALGALWATGDEVARRFAGHPELVQAIRQGLDPLARERADLDQDPTDWGQGERDAARVALDLDPDLARAYELKEALGEAAHLARRQPSLGPAAFDLWVALAEGSGVGPFVKLARRARRWRPEAVAHMAAGRDLRGFTRAGPVAAVATPLLAGVAAAAVVVVPLGLSWIPIPVQQSFVPDWVRWNYSGYQGKSTWPEYHALMRTMARVGKRYGCGRAMWEYGPELNDLGTPMALMLLPFWTRGCIDSMEGLLFESSATTPYHFINQAELSLHPSEAEANLPYGPLDVAAGVQHLQLLGVRYYMAFTPQAEAQAARDPSLTRIATSGPWPTVVGNKTIKRTWDIYLVHDSSTVVPLSHRPVVLTAVARTGPGWLKVSIPWYMHPRRWGVVLAESGPPSWPRVRASTLDLGGQHAHERTPAVPVPPTAVSHVSQGDNRISFDVTRTGTPVLVKTSYFPNWQAHGARGPWRVTPNLMVVVPSSHHVSLVYGRTKGDWAGIAVTLAGLAGVVWMGWRGPVPMPEHRPLLERARGRRGEEGEDGPGEPPAGPGADSGAGERELVEARDP